MVPSPRLMRQTVGLCGTKRILGAQKEGVCLHVAVNLLRFTVSSEQPAQNSHPPHPGYLLRHSSIGCTFSLTCKEEELSPL